MSFVYPDNNIIKIMRRDPKASDQLHDWSIKKFGRSWEIIPSYYSFFEYIGFHKNELNIPQKILQPKTGITQISSKTIRELEEEFSTIQESLLVFVKTKLFSLKPKLNDLLEKQNAENPNNKYFKMKSKNHYNISNGIEQGFFGEIIQQLKNSFPEFVEVSASYLSWDIFCGISLKGLNVESQRKKQFGFWLQNYEQGIMLPFAKIMDDLINSPKGICLKNNEDMVDAEMLTYAILGYRTKPNEIKPVAILTYDDKTVTNKRIENLKKCISKIENVLGKTIQKSPGIIYCLDPETQTSINTIDISFPIIN
ncbi:hypothetical protein KAT92_02050 [Candidatus Babeliales bacterium]|nr:hypothetical protein [Candidatus Babeliales bacterium]